MTLNEYLNQTEEKILRASSLYEVESILKSAQKVLNESKISEEEQRQFWADLYKKLGGDQDVVLEKQGADSLSDILAAAKRVIADKVKK
ncbi:hypothetical protein [Salinivibrio proteolyticus]|uniref:Uncharacterized protein n=1 Tax=Salinivibrio proteolyticus TaxID=334715 RepID=A0ABY7LC06_9GAMM|nr:hypothetical protein [Salinivibrio proteolyticus]WBA13681.1 hypothetical protein N7E60_07915 [Salinivibrio proteolyticus]